MKREKKTHELHYVCIKRFAMNLQCGHIATSYPIAANDYFRLNQARFIVCTMYRIIYHIL